MFQADSRKGKFKAALFFLAIISYFLSLPSTSCAQQPTISALTQPTEIPLSSEGATFSVEITVPENHHAYLDRGDDGYYIPIQITFDDPDGNYATNLLSAPKGEREESVGATVLRGKGIFQYEIKMLKPVEGELLLSINSQICNDDTKLCYPPETLQRSLKIVRKQERKPEETSKSELSAKPSAGVDVSAWVERKFEEYSTNTLLAFLVVLLAGVLSAATPCVYPMLPITYAILTARGKGSRREGWFHSFAYFGGIVLTYFLLGFVAGMTGGVLNAVMQSPATNLLIAFFFLLFAVAMFDLIDLSFIQGMGDKINSLTSGKTSYAATMLMGVAAGIIVSPCVGPVVFALLLQVADRIADANNQLLAAGEQISFLQKTLIALKGSIVMAGFGVGIGLPFLLIGLLSNRLPRSGQWMMYVKYAMGAIILFVSWLYFLKGFQSAGAGEAFSKAMTYALFAATGFIGLVHCLIQRKKGFGCDVVKAAFFGLLLVGGLILFAQTKCDKQEAGETVALGQVNVEVKGNLSWHRDFDAALKEAKATGKPIFIDFFAYWCANCVAFDKLTTTDTILNDALRSAVLLRIYDTDPIFSELKKQETYRELNIGLPFFVILKPDGSFFWKTTRYDGVDDFRQNIMAATGQ